MQTKQIGNYEIVIYDKFDGSAYEPDHDSHTLFLSVVQEHGSEIYVPSKQQTGKQEDVSADAIVAPRHVAAGVRIADCNPIAILGNNWYAVIHGSRRSLKQGILQKSVKELCRQEQGEVDMRVYVGPSIRKEVYTVGKEFKDYFSSQFLLKKDSNLYFDMIAFIEERLVTLGIKKEHIAIHPDCTLQNNEKYFSYRAGEKGKANFMGIKAL